MAFIDPRTPDEIYRNLEKTGLRVMKVPLTRDVAGPLSGHPDIQLFVHGTRVFVHPHIDKRFLRELDRLCDVTICSTELHADYPRDIYYNIACTGRFAIHKQGCTEPSIFRYLDENSISFIAVKQGYSKCSTLVADEKGIITSDRSIAGEALKAGIDSLLISAGHVELPGYKYGFIGGATGRFMNMVLFTGSIDEHPDRKRIHEFIESRGLRVKILSKLKILDTGSILVTGD